MVWKIEKGRGGWGVEWENERGVNTHCCEVFFFRLRCRDSTNSVNLHHESSQPTNSWEGTAKKKCSRYYFICIKALWCVLCYTWTRVIISNQGWKKEIKRKMRVYYVYIDIYVCVCIYMIVSLNSESTTGWSRFHWQTASGCPSFRPSVRLSVVAHTLRINSTVSSPKIQCLWLSSYSQTEQQRLIHSYKFYASILITFDACWVLTPFCRFFRFFFFISLFLSSHLNNKNR